MNNYKQISTALKENGIAENHNWLSEDEIIFITQKILKLSRAKGENRSHLPINKLSILLKTIKFQFSDPIIGGPINFPFSNKFIHDTSKNISDR